MGGLGCHAKTRNATQNQGGRKIIFPKKFRFYAFHSDLICSLSDLFMFKRLMNFLGGIVKQKHVEPLFLPNKCTRFLWIAIFQQQDETFGNLSPPRWTSLYGVISGNQLKQWMIFFGKKSLEMTTSCIVCIHSFIPFHSTSVHFISFDPYNIGLESLLSLLRLLAILGHVQHGPCVAFAAPLASQPEQK